MEAKFRRALVQLVQVGYFQSGLFLLGMAVAQPPQTALSPEGSPCVPSPMHFSKLTETTVRMLLALMSAMVAAMIPILWLPDERPLNGDGRSVRVVRYLRAAAAFLAVSFSLLAMLLGFVATYQILVVKTSLSSCWTRTTTATVIGFYAGATLVCSGYYVATYGVVLFSD